jgi:hypothetical protein
MAPCDLTAFRFETCLHRIGKGTLAGNQFIRVDFQRASSLATASLAKQWLTLQM